MQDLTVLLAGLMPLPFARGRDCDLQRVVVYDGIHRHHPAWHHHACWRAVFDNWLVTLAFGAGKLGNGVS